MARRSGFRKRRKVRQIGNAVNLTKSPGTIVPNSVFVKLAYDDSFTFDLPTGGIPVVHLFSANSLFDPDVDVAGHQPRGFDELMAFYNHFTVIGAKITVTVLSTHTVPCTYGIAVRTTDTKGATPAQYLESGRAVWKTHNWYKTNGGIHATQISHKFSAPELFNNRRPLDDDAFQGTASTGPLEEAFFHVFGFSNTATTDPASEAPRVHIEYLAVLHEPKTLPVSS